MFEMRSLKAAQPWKTALSDVLPDDFVQTVKSNKYVCVGHNLAAVAFTARKLGLDLGGKRVDLKHVLLLLQERGALPFYGAKDERLVGRNGPAAAQVAAWQTHTR
ncbi:MAG: hypothetical protein AAFU61_17880, partial [Pseudomonadota bacterium]